ncbi:MAG: hypothetical protein J0L57_13065 [Burkholderiales bacterium]|nr:hypothetical protein [Burkholderiales bacterium]
MVASHWPRRRARVLRRVPALSSLRGHMQAQDSRWPGVWKRDKPLHEADTLGALRALGLLAEG